MSNIIVPGDNEAEEEGQELEALTYKATEDDEERFFLMYHMHFQPSEVEQIAPDYRKWLITRFMVQKKMEQEMMERQRIMANIGTSLKV